MTCKMNNFVFVIVTIAITATVTGSESKFEKSALKEHNRLRALHGSDPLILDGKLSKSAEKWAKHLAVVGKISHSGKHAENVFSGGTCDDNAGKQVTKNWYNEIEKYDFENVENNLPPNWKQFNAIGHFTQVVWKRATKMGVGKALSASGTCWVVANYDTGNYNSAEAFKNNVKKPL